MSDRRPVISAIPNYNMAENLRKLLNQVLQQDYDAVFVLDDASTDHSVDVAREYGSDVTFVRSPRNRGAGATRNLILGHVDDRTLIHFVDADMELQTSDTAELARTVFADYADAGVGVIGGLVRRLDGTQEPHNFGDVFSAWGTFTSGLPLLMERLRHRPAAAHAVRRALRWAMAGCPDVLGTPVAKPAYWVHEGNMLVDARVLYALGGYDTTLRSHEVQDLAIRLHAMGVGRRFDPRLSALHHHVDVRGKHRSRWEFDAVVHLLRKHGVFRYLTDR